MATVKKYSPAAMLARNGPEMSRSSPARNAGSGLSPPRQHVPAEEIETTPVPHQKAKAHPIEWIE